MAIIEVFPNSPTAIQDAVTASNEGDVILVHKGLYYENVQVPSNKNNIRIISKHKHRAILDGKNNLLQAFALLSVAGVEIFGFRIKNYLYSGVKLSSGKSNRVIYNKISDIGDDSPLGILVNNSAGNLLMKNSIMRVGSAGVGTGIKLDGVSGNWVLKNKLKNNSAHGIVVINSNHDAIVGNKISHNKSQGIQMSGLDNNLIFDNKISNNGADGVNAQSTNNLIVDSKIKGNLGSGLLFNFNYNFAGFNEIKDNKLSGGSGRE